VATPGEAATTVLNLNLTQAISYTQTINCPGQPPVVVPMVLPAAGGQFTLPLKQKAGRTHSYNLPNGGKLSTTVTLTTPCNWDASKPPGPVLTFDADPREPTFASGVPDQTLSIDSLTGLAGLSKRDELIRDAVDLGLVKFGGFNFQPHLHTSSAPSKTMPGKFCVWIDWIKFKVDLIQVYVASDLASSSTCNDLVKAHENRHFNDVQVLLRDYANELVRQLKSIGGPNDARLFANAGGEAQITLEATNKISQLENQYSQKSKAKSAAVDLADKASTRQACSRFAHR
jgi:hypothetical protein